MYSLHNTGIHLSQLLVKCSFDVGQVRREYNVHCTFVLPGASRAVSAMYIHRQYCSQLVRSLEVGQNAVSRYKVYRRGQGVNNRPAQLVEEVLLEFHSNLFQILH